MKFCYNTHLFSFQNNLKDLDPAYKIDLDFWDRFWKELENVFMKHYAPNHMPDPKGEWTFKENNSELHHGIYSKVNQFIYTLVCNYMPNIRILAKVVLQIFCSQGCSYTKCLCPENESNSTESLRNVLKS